MPVKPRNLFAKTRTFLQFARRQRRQFATIEASLVPPDEAVSLRIDAGEAGWRASGQQVVRGQRFRVTAQGYHWIAKPLGLVIEPKATLWMRIGHGPIRKVLDADAVYEAWADGEIELFSKTLSEWSDRNGAVFPGKRKPLGPGISVAIRLVDEDPTAPNRLAEWEHLWRLGEGRIFTVEGGTVDVHTHADVGILRKDVDVPLDESTHLSWDWLISSLPSETAEDLAFTHDYLSLAIEFDNGRDLTYMWSKKLADGHIFQCPLNWWCERETHVVIRSGERGLGEWQHEERSPAADYRAAIEGALPSRIVGVWIIANSVFQRGVGAATFRNIQLGK